MVSDFDYRGITADDEATLRGLATEIGRVEQAESESWLMDLAPKYAKARSILKKATGKRQFGKRWNQWLAMQPTGGKSRTGDKLAQAHDLVESWRLTDAQRAIIARYRSVVCDLAAPTMPPGIQEEFRPRLLAGEDVTRVEVKKRRQEYGGKSPADKPAPVDLPEPEEDVEALKARIAELEAQVSRVAELEAENAKLRRESSVDLKKMGLSELAKQLLKVSEACAKKMTSSNLGDEWPSMIGVSVDTEEAAVSAHWRDINYSMRDTKINLEFAIGVLGKIGTEIANNRIDLESRPVWDGNRNRGWIVPEAERSRRLLPYSVRLTAERWSSNYKGRPALTKPVTKWLRENHPGLWGAYHTAHGKYIMADEMSVRFADRNAALEFKMNFG